MKHASVRRVAGCLALWAASTAQADSWGSYMLYCGGCHLPDGSGTPPEVPSLRDELGRLAGLEGGRAYLVRVPGAAQAPVSDRELAGIINWILRTFNSDTLAADFEPLSEREVAAARKKVLADPLRYRAQLWERGAAAR